MKIKIPKCIYFDNSGRILTYNKQEHVIPASLGGRAKLPKGFVSDEANSYFSKYEMKAVRDTILSINRINNGPGKRGTLNVKKVTNPEIKLFKNLKDNKDIVPVVLGFMFCGCTHEIPQILFTLNNDNSVKLPIVILNTFPDYSLSILLKDVLKSFYKFIHDDNRKFNVIYSELKVHIRYINIGTFNNRWFVSSSFSKNLLQKFFEIVKIKDLPEELPIFINPISIYKWHNKLPDAFDESFYFIYFKTAFNVLAFFTDNEIVLHKQFDGIRNVILNLYDFNKYIVEETMPDWLLEFVDNEVKPKEHFILISTENKCIKAYVSFYRERITSYIRLSENYEGDQFRKCIICNWMNGSERYLDLLNKKSTTFLP